MIEYYVYENPPPGARRASGTRRTRGKKESKMAKKRRTPRRGPGGRFLPAAAGGSTGRKKKRRKSGGSKRRRRSSNGGKRRASGARSSGRRSRGRRRTHRNPPRGRGRRGVPANVSGAGRTLRKWRNPANDGMALAIQLGQGVVGLGVAFSAPAAAAKAFGRPALAQGWSAVGISTAGALAAGWAGRAFLSRRAGKAMLFGGLLGAAVRLVVHLWPRAGRYLPGMSDYVDVGIRDYVDVGIRDYVATPPELTQAAPLPAALPPPRLQRAEVSTQENNYLYGDDDELDGDDEDGMGTLNYLTVSAQV